MKLFRQRAKQILLLVIALGITPHFVHAEVATDLFNAYEPQIFQIKVIDKNSSSKASIGSGFLIGENGLIATNFHVIANAALHPEQYSLSYVDHLDQSGDVSIVDIDVIHDLALVKMASPNDALSPFQINVDPVLKGSDIYAIGNPRDLGMNIVDGTFGGLLENSLYEKILFSGSLNPGMSGGPAINKTGEIIGVNVATAGNQLSFLVPAKYLVSLIEKDRPKTLDQINSEIQHQLITNQDHYLTPLYAATWETIKFGEFNVPNPIADYFRCWGDSTSEDSKQYSASISQCATTDRIFLAPGLTTGMINAKYTWVKSISLNSMQFYQQYGQNYYLPLGFQHEDDEYMENYKCHTEFIHLSDHEWKAVYCASQYKQYPKLYDINFIMASVSDDNQGLIVELSASGISRANATPLIDKFMSNVTWQNPSL